MVALAITLVITNILWLLYFQWWRKKKTLGSTGGMEEYVSLSEFYDEIVAIGGDLPHTCTSDDLGWNLNRDGQIEIDMPAGKMSNGEPCLVLDYHVAPRYDYSKLS